MFDEVIFFRVNGIILGYLETPKRSPKNNGVTIERIVKLLK